MSWFFDIRSDLGPDPPEDVVALAQRLESERPVPSAAFRGELRRRLLSQSCPARLRMLITGYASAGAALLVAGALSAAGLGPLGA
jgi:hypothetical protein